MYEYRATLERIVDGDTFDLDLDLGLRVHTRARVRLRGVDTPETYGVRRDTREWRRGRAASDFAAGWLAEHGPALIVRTFHDRTGKYGRWLAEIVDPDTGAELGAALVEAGHARRAEG